jgi:hypothetical protein
MWAADRGPAPCTRCGVAAGVAEERQRQRTVAAVSARRSRGDRRRRIAHSYDGSNQMQQRQGVGNSNRRFTGRGNVGNDYAVGPGRLAGPTCH